MDLSLRGESRLDASTGSDSDRSHSSYSNVDSGSPKDVNNSISMVRAAQHPLLNLTPVQQAAAAFSIAAILSKNFGQNNAMLMTQNKISPPPLLAIPTIQTATPTIVASAVAAKKSKTSSKSASQPAKTLFPPNNTLWPAWVYCTRYSDRPSSGPRCRRNKRKAPATPKTATKPKQPSPPTTVDSIAAKLTSGDGDSDSNDGASDEKRPRTAFTAAQLRRLKDEFAANPYLTETRRNALSKDLLLNENQIKIWFQNKRAKIKKQQNVCNPLQLNLMAQGLYNHSTLPADEDDDDDDELGGVDV